MDSRKDVAFELSHDVTFVTAHPCSPSQRVRFLKSPTSPVVQRFDFPETDMLGNNAGAGQRAGHPLHKHFNYVVIHISQLLEKDRDATLTDLLSCSPTNKPNTIVPRNNNHILVIDCITNISEGPQSPSLERMDSPPSPILERRESFPAAAKMHFESRRRQFGSDLEVLVRAFCAEKGWNAIISRRKRGCLACAIREAAALDWRVVIRVT